MSSKDLHIETQKITIEDLQRQLSEFEEAHRTTARELQQARERIAGMKAAGDQLAVFASAYSSHPKRNPSDGLDAALKRWTERSARAARHAPPPLVPPSGALLSWLSEDWQPSEDQEVCRDCHYLRSYDAPCRCGRLKNALVARQTSRTAERPETPPNNETPQDAPKAHDGHPTPPIG